MVEVFKTNVKQDKEAVPLIKALVEHLPKHKVNFDLDDCDKILRVEGADFNAASVIRLLKNKGFKCNVL